MVEQYQKLTKENSEERQDGTTYPSQSDYVIMQRFRKARFEALKTEGIITAINSKFFTGSPTEEDIERTALAIYNDEGKLGTTFTFLRSFTLDVGQEFPFKEAFKYLRTTKTWDILIQSRLENDGPCVQ